MTVLVALDRLKLSDVVTVDGRAAAVGQESIYLPAGEQITVRELVQAALIQSANNAADALALAVAPDFDAFARLMNAKARALGMKDTHFVRPDGLDATGAYSTARDVSVLAQEAMRNPFIRKTVRQITAVIGGNRELHTWNDLLGTFPGVIGVKTGHTSQAGWSQVAAVRADVGTIYATILGAPSRTQRNADLQRLLVWGISRYRIVDAIVGNRAYAEAKPAVRARRRRARRLEAAAARRASRAPARREGDRSRDARAARAARPDRRPRRDLVERPAGRAEPARHLQGRRPAGPGRAARLVRGRDGAQRGRARLVIAAHNRSS